MNAISFVPPAFPGLPTKSIMSPRHALRRALLTSVLHVATSSFAARRSISFVGQVQKTYSANELLALAAQQTSPTPQEAVRLLSRLVQLMPRGPSSVEAAAEIRQDRRLGTFLRDLAVDALTPQEVLNLLWSCAVLQRPLRRSEVPKEELFSALNDAAPHLSIFAAAEAQWAWESLGRDASSAWPRPPTRLIARAAPLPFAVRVGAIDPSLLSMDVLRAEASPKREVIKSGSAAPTLQTLAETRLTAWQSVVGERFAYSGKEMSPRVGDEDRPGFSPAVAAVRDALAQPPVDRFFDSVLVNYYEGGKVGMRFHSDPGQGEDGPWGFSTCVVSAGDCRQFVFRRIGDPSSRCTFSLRAGDVVEMFDRCQQEYQHSVKTEASDEAAGPRISLVFKRTHSTEQRRISEGERPEGRSVS